MPEIQVCDCCRNRITDGSAVVTALTAPYTAGRSEETLCEDCHTDLHTHCDRCEAAVRRSSTTIINNENIYCQTCVDRHTAQCQDCLSRTIASSLTTVLDRTVCRSCLGSYQRCRGCRTYLARRGDLRSGTECDCGYRYCENCYSARSCCRRASIADHSLELSRNGHNAITDYHPRFEWTFQSDKTDMYSQPYFGVELEIEGDWPDADDEDDSIYTNHTRDTRDYPLFKAAKIIGEQLPGVAFCSHDGSLENGMEIVTVPHKKQAFKKLNMHNVLKALEAAGATSEVGARCGMHIHIEKTPWLKAYKKFSKIQDKVQLRSKYQNVCYNYDIYQMFFNLMWEDIFKLSRRLQRQVERYCAFQRSVDNKYVAVNIYSKKTIEVRIWRGTLNPYYFNVYLQFTFAVLDYIQQHSCVRILRATAALSNSTRRLDIEKIAIRQSFHDFLEQTQEYHLLVKRLKELELFGFEKEAKKKKKKLKRKEKQNVRNSSKTNRSEDRPRYCGQNVGS